MHKASIAAMFCLALTAPAQADFSIDITTDNFRKATGTVVLRDLSVGEKATAGFVQLCAQNGTLYIHTMTRVSAKPSENGTNWTMTKTAGGAFSIEVTAPESRKGNVTEAITRSLTTAMLRPCSSAPFDSGNLGRVADINGVTSLSAYLKTISNEAK